MKPSFGSAASACLLALCAGLAGSAGAQARAPAPPRPLAGSNLVPAPSWAELSDAERSALAPLAKSFDRLDNAQRRKWKVVADRFPSWPADKQKTAQSRMLALRRRSSGRRGSCSSMPTICACGAGKIRQGGGFWSTKRGLLQCTPPALQLANRCPAHLSNRNTTCHQVQASANRIILHGRRLQLALGFLLRWAPAA